MSTVIPLAITAIYLSNKVCWIKVTPEHMCLSVYRHSCCEYLTINQVVSSGKLSNKWSHLLQPVAFGSRALKTGE